VSILCLGGWHIGAVKDPGEAIRIMHAALDRGVTFFDNAWDYHDGGSEEIMGRALAQDGRRDKVFLMTKNCERDYQGSLRNLDESLRRLRTDHVDLWQFHEMVYDNDPDWVFEKGGIRAAEEARRQGKVRYIGFTGHKDPRIHLKMLARDFAWDAAQMPVNVMDAHYRSFQNEVIPVCLEKNVAAIGMKSLGGGSPRAAIPSGTPISALDCRRYALAQPIASLVVGIVSMEDLEQDVALARDFEPLGETETAALLEQARPVAGDGRFELFKSSQSFDGPHHRRQHGFRTA
jgi:aryl-alcohol dehydrogenase-like predicted oxidoreductase